MFIILANYSSLGVQVVLPLTTTFTWFCQVKAWHFDAMPTSASIAVASRARPIFLSFA